MDAQGVPRENCLMAQPGAFRKHLARTLNAAYASGLLSRETFEHRVDQVLTARLIDPRRMIGDLNARASLPSQATELIRTAAGRIGSWIAAGQEERRPAL